MEEQKTTPDLQNCPRCGYLIIEHSPSDPIPEGHNRLSNLVIERLYGGLTALSRMSLPHDKAENKVAVSMHKYLETPWQILEHRRKKMFERLSPPPGMEISARLNELRSMELDDIMHDTQDILAFPLKLKLTKADMPKDGAGLAAIKFQLAGYLFDLDEDG